MVTVSELGRLLDGRSGLRAVASGLQEWAPGLRTAVRIKHTYHLHALLAPTSTTIHGRARAALNRVRHATLLRGQLSLNEVQAARHSLPGPGTPGSYVVCVTHPCNTWHQEREASTAAPALTQRAGGRAILCATQTRGAQHPATGLPLDWRNVLCRDR